jgi:hypothetical protein
MGTVLVFITLTLASTAEVFMAEVFTVAAVIAERRNWFQGGHRVRGKSLISETETGAQSIFLWDQTDGSRRCYRSNSFRKCLENCPIARSNNGSAEISLSGLITPTVSTERPYKLRHSVSGESARSNLACPAVRACSRWKRSQSK